MANTEVQSLFTTIALASVYSLFLIGFMALMSVGRYLSIALGTLNYMFSSWDIIILVLLQ